MFRSKQRDLKILDFDIENRPLHYWFDGNTTAEITVIAWAWWNRDGKHGPVRYRSLAPPPHHVSSADDMLLDFLDAYNEAEMVTGHFIRGHDLPLINAGLMEAGFSVLSEKLTSDTKLDLTKRKYLSVSQKNLSEMLGVEKPKVPMPMVSWRESNRLTPDGIELAVARAVGDVLQHMELRSVLLDRNLIAPPRLWTPGGGGRGNDLPFYTP